MKKMTSMKSFRKTVVFELMEIKMHICNERNFEAGVGLGSLINWIMYRQDEEYDDDEIAEQEEKYDYEIMYEEKCEEFIELKEENFEKREENKKIKLKLQELTTLIKKLFNKDHIYVNSREEVRNELLKFEELTDGFDGKIVEKNQ